MITGFPETNNPIKAIKVSVQDYFLKPFDTGELIRSIESHLEKAARLADMSRTVNERTRFNILGVGIASP